MDPDPVNHLTGDIFLPLINHLSGKPPVTLSPPIVLKLYFNPVKKRTVWMI